MSNINWTMNCILFGAEVADLVRAGKDTEALAKIKNLMSEFDDTTAVPNNPIGLPAEYLLMRLKER